SRIGETMLQKAVATSMNVAWPMLYGDGHLLARLAEHGSPLTQKLVSRIRTGKQAYYATALTIDTLSSDKEMLRLAKKAHTKNLANPGIIEQLIREKMRCKQGDILV